MQNFILLVEALQPANLTSLMVALAIVLVVLHPLSEVNQVPNLAFFTNLLPFGRPGLPLYNFWHLHGPTHLGP